MSETGQKSDWMRGMEQFIARDREEAESRKSKWQEWSRPLLEYFELGRQESWMFDNASQRIWRRVFEEPGLLRVNHNTFPQRAIAQGLGPEEELIVPKLLFEQFHGIERALDGIRQFFWGSKESGEAARQILFLVGPPGSGKSQIVGVIKNSLVGHIFFGIKGCPIHESPLRLIPLHLREKFSKDIGYKIPLDEDICPVCQKRMKELEGRYEEFKVEAVGMSVRRNTALVAVPPFDPNTMGSEVLIGEPKIELMHKYSTGSSERMNFSGALDRGTGGVVEVWEFFKSPREMRHLFLGATQEKRFPSPEYFTNLSADFVIIAHSNIPEFLRWKSNPEEEALMDRLFPVLVPYSMSYSEEKRIYKKMLVRSTAKFHFVPGSLPFVAQFTVASRLEAIFDQDTTKTLNADDILKVLRMLNGEDVNSQKVIEHRQEHPKEGLYGLSTRFIIKAIEEAISDAALASDIGEGEVCVTVDMIIRKLQNVFKEDLIFASAGDAKKEIERSASLLKMLSGDFAEKFCENLKHKLFQNLRVSGLLHETIGEGRFESLITAGLNHYISSAAMMVKVGPLMASALEGVDVKYTEKVEQYLGIDKNSAPIFREEIVKEHERLLQAHERIDAKTPSTELLRLRDAVERVLLDQHSDEFLQKVEEYVLQTSRYPLVKKQWLEKLPQYHCIDCLLWVLKRSRSPYLALPSKSKSKSK